MSFEVLCAPYFPAKEAEALEQAARAAHVSTSQFIREAVRRFSAQCVPTQGASDRRATAT